MIVIGREEQNDTIYYILAAVLVGLFFWYVNNQNQVQIAQVAQPLQENVEIPTTAQGDVPSIEQLADKYGAERLPVTDLPTDALVYTALTMDRIATQYDVRAGDVVARQSAETKGNGLHYGDPCRDNDAGAAGPWQITQGWWDAYGVDANGDGVKDRCHYEDGAAAVANHLAKNGARASLYQSNPQEFYRKLRDAISLYNSGRVYARGKNIRQSAASDWTVGTYVEHAVGVGDWWQANVAGQIRTEPVQQEVSNTERSGVISQPYENMPRIAKAFGVSAGYQPGGKHTGIDMGRGIGTPILSISDGVVEYVGWLYGNTPGYYRGDSAVVIDHGDNVYSIYSHNSEALVQKGQQVRAGQPIALEGSEGYSSTSHLHLEVHVGAPFNTPSTPWTGGEFVDPCEIISC